jgi:hypothetical protein
LPPPVGISTNTSRPLSVAFITAAWFVRKLKFPNTSLFTVRSSLLHGNVASQQLLAASKPNCLDGVLGALFSDTTDDDDDDDDDERDDADDRGGWFEKYGEDDDDDDDIADDDDDDDE